MQAHTDVVVFNDEIENHIDVEKSHEKEHHKNDSEEEKNTEHHHHCNTINLENIYILNDFIVCFNDLPIYKELILYNENLNYFSYLKGVFQPPKNF